ncbi:glycosyltransferase family 2 protein [Nitrosospira multiformis]|uniref:Glycosyltransferase, GT2 family n=1 Tax=Nitrosospira multiformis TaxID=1231 RepID=A0A1I7I7U6_9PROT|nr:glycosyltransferase [Nitrosospira multiformis]SFU68924.1 Glycosyltransferase, GT2 family [Nitrosospira multiformis]
MNKPFISVLTTLYNHEHYIHETLMSAINQTLVPDEIIVIDDASSDNSVSIASQISHPSIHLFPQPNNLGGATTIKGLRACKGDFIAILNSDDYWQSSKLQSQINYMQANPNCGAVFTRVVLVDEKGTYWEKNSHQLQLVFGAQNRDRASWLKYMFGSGNPFCASSALIRRECLTRLGPLDGRYIQLQDLEMWLRIAINGFDLHILNDELTHYRVTRNSSNMSTGTGISRSIYIYEYSRLLRHFWQLPTLRELQNIFPEITVSLDGDNLLTMFYLANFASKQGSLHHLQFAVDTMFEWGADEASMNKAYKCHGFTHADYRHFIAQNPLGSIEEGRLSRKFKSLAGAILPSRANHILRQASKRILKR